jgi:hypothetical protein
MPAWGLAMEVALRLRASIVARRSRQEASKTMASVKVTLWDAVVPKRGLVRQTQRGPGLGTNYALSSGYSSITAERSPV